METHGEAIEGFLAAWLGDPSPEQRDDVAAVLQRTHAALRDAWADGPPLLPELWSELARCVPEGTSDDAVASALDRMQVVDLHLALACRHQHAGALSRFEREQMTGLSPAVARVDGSSSFVDEIKQRLRTKLLVGDGEGPPKIAHYTGQGPLQTWLRVVAVREALSSVRAERRRALVSDEPLMAIEASATGPELGALKEQYREHFRVAFHDALRQLEPAQRNLLRLHYLHGLSIDELGRLLDLHRSSAARRIAKTRQDLLSHTRRGLLARLEVGRQDFDQLMGLIASRLDLSIERFLAERDDASASSR